MRKQEIATQPITRGERIRCTMTARTHSTQTRNKEAHQARASYVCTSRSPAVLRRVPHTSCSAKCSSLATLSMIAFSLSSLLLTVRPPLFEPESARYDDNKEERTPNNRRLR